MRQSTEDGRERSVLASADSIDRRGLTWHSDWLNNEQPDCGGLGKPSVPENRKRLDIRSVAVVVQITLGWSRCSTSLAIEKHYFTYLQTFPDLPIA